MAVSMSTFTIMTEMDRYFVREWPEVFPGSRLVEDIILYLVPWSTVGLEPQYRAIYLLGGLILTYLFRSDARHLHC